MDLSTYITDQGGTGGRHCPVLAKIAKRAGCTTAVLYQIRLGHKRASWRLSERISKATNAAVAMADLRPDIAQAVLGCVQDEAA